MIREVDDRERRIKKTPGASRRITFCPLSSALCLLSSALFCACASFSPPSSQAGFQQTAAFSDEFSLEGRFSFRFEAQNYFGRISWRHAGASDAILLSSSFGQGIAQMTVGEKGTRLTLSDGKAQEAADSETLMRGVLGYPLSIKRLSGWISGRGAGEEGADADTDAQGRLRRLRHEGWIVDYAYESDDTLERPSRIRAVRIDTQAELRLAIEGWQARPLTEKPALSKDKENFGE